MATTAPTSQYLATQTSSLEAQSPVSPSQARTAQIPLQNFNLPTFPEEAFSSDLSALILTADIPLTSYTALLTQPFSIPRLPPTITSLTLELFSLGYPPSFLTELGKALPSLKSLTLYSQLFGGTTPASHSDALTFLSSQTLLTELHLLDVFGEAGFYTQIASNISPSLKFLEVNFTYRHSDPAFLSSLPAEELVAFLKKGGLLGFTASISAPDVTDDEDDREGTEVGILPVERRCSTELVEMLGKVGEEMVMCDLTMFDLDLSSLETVLRACPKVKILGVTVVVEDGWGEVFDVLGKEGGDVEVLEVVGVPGKRFVASIKGGGEAGLSADVLRGVVLAGCTGMKSVKVSVLRTRAETWVRVGEEWVLKA